ncbi:TetR/AcrR family transcriptional regulator [Paenibacillus mesotrionivorans]|uniref:TetR/AcrR family transcriptional regulator n=1 Tax=Paenibacillus mesotrionivorans TaxID=3160968 RepID=A0ACC7NZ82_9BACL
MAENTEQWLEDMLLLMEGNDGKKTEKQLKIIQAATEIFSEKGYSAASTSEIAQRAGVAEGTIFRHYKTKRDLLLSIVGPILAKTVAPLFMRDFAKVLDQPYTEIEDFYKTVLRDRLNFARKNAKILRIVIQELPFQPELLGQVKVLFSQYVFERIGRLYAHFQEQGQIMEAPSFRIIRFSVTTIVGMVLTHSILLPEIPIDDEEEINWTIDVLMHGIAKRS